MDILIIGGGIAGISTAYHLATQQPTANIHIIEKEAQPARLASGNNSGMVHHFHRNRQMRKTLSRAIQRLQDYHRQSDQRFLDQRPSLWRFSRTTAESLKQDPASWGSRSPLSSSDVPDNLQPDSEQKTHWMMFEQDGLLQPQHFVETLLSDAQKEGVSIETSTHVQSGTRQHDKWILSMKDQSTRTGDIVVNASGAWGDTVAERLNISTQQLVPHTRHLFYASETILPEHIGFFWDRHAGMYFRHYKEGTLMSPCDNTPADPEERPDIHDPVRDLLRDKLTTCYPQFQSVTIQDYWWCQRTKSSSSLPVIKQDPDHPNIYWVAALYGHGMTASMWVGQQAADKMV